jgi:hypothetical protein
MITAAILGYYAFAITLLTTIGHLAGRRIVRQIESVARAEPQASSDRIVESKLDHSGQVNAELEMKVEYLHAKASRIRAENVTAETQEFENAFDRLTLILDAAKNMTAKMAGKDRDELVFFILDIQNVIAEAQSVLELVRPEGLAKLESPKPNQ